MRLAKRIISSILIVIMTLFNPYYAWAAPEGGEVVAGGATIDQSQPNITNINTTSDRTIMNFAGFNTTAAERVNINQPAPSSAFLGRISGGPTSFDGYLGSNGQVFLVNPNGILFGPNSKIDVGGFMASTLDIKNENFLAGKYIFEKPDGALPSYIINKGRIQASPEGFVMLVSPAISNEGVIVADVGKVGLISGEKVTLDFTGSGLINFVVDDKVARQVLGPDGKAMEAAINNTGLVQATGGKVLVTAEAEAGIFQNLINQDGVITANSIVESDGVIKLVSASEGIVQNTGTMDVSAAAAGAEGGSVTIDGEMVGQFGTIRADSVDGDGGDVRLNASNVLAMTGLTTVNAGASGNGGTVIAFSPETTLFWPSALIEARGGVASGDGGFVEVSGKGHIESYGFVDASAPNGAAGLFFIDPAYNITVQAAAGTLDGATPNFVAGADSSTVGEAAIEAALNAGTSVLIQTADGGTQAGSITQDVQIDKTAGANCTITYNAADDIILNSGIVSTTGQLAVVLNANGAYGTATGAGDVDINGAITTNGGTFTSTGINFDNTGGIITTAGGGVTINNTGAVTVGAAINTSGAAGGAVLLSGPASTTLNANINTDSANITISGNNSITIGATPITIDTESGANDSAGNIAFGSSSVSASGASGKALTLDASTNTTNKNGGAITIGAFSNTAGFYVKDLTINTRTSSTPGTGTNGVLTLNGNISLDNNGAAAASFTATTTRSGVASGGTVLNSNITIDTEQTASAGINGGNISLGGRNSGNAAGRTLTLNSSTAQAGQSGGTVTLGGTGSANGSNPFGVSIDTSGAGGAGVITLNGGTYNLDDNGAGTASSFTVTGGGNIILANNTTIDTEQTNNGPGGAVNFNTSAISGDVTAGRTLTVNTGTTNAGSNGGDVTLASFGNAGGTYVNQLTVDANSASGTKGNLYLTNNIQLDNNGGTAAQFNFNNGGGVVVQSNSLTIDTEEGNTANGGSVNFGGSVIVGLGGNSRALTINTATTFGGGFGGAVTFGEVYNAGGALGATYLNSFSVDSTADNDGFINVSNNISVDDNGAGTAGTVTLAGNVSLGGSITISTQQGDNAAGGDVTLVDSTIFGNAAGRDLTINTSTANAGSSGGDVDLGLISNGGPNSYLNDLIINTTPGAGGTAGDIFLDGAINLDDNGAGAAASMQVTGGGNIELTNTVTIDTEQDNTAAGGFVNFGTSQVSGDAAGRDLTITTSTSAAGLNGGAVTLAAFGNGGGAYINDLSVSASGGAGGTAGITTFTNDISLDDNGPGDLSSLSVSGSGSIYVGRSPLVIDTEQGNTAAGGSVNFGASAVSGNAAGRDLTILTATSFAGANGGAIDVSAFSNQGGFYINDFYIDASPGAGGFGGTTTFNSITVNLDNDGSAAPGDPASLNVIGGGVVSINPGAGNVTIDTEQNAVAGVAGGYVNIDTSIVAGAGAGRGLIIDTRAGGAASQGGAVTLDEFGNNGVAYLLNLDIRTTGTGASAGIITLKDNISLDYSGAAATLTVTGGGNIYITSSITIDTENGNTDAGGTVNLGTSAVSASGGSKNLTINTATTAAGQNGGAVTLATFNNTDGAYVTALSVNSSSGAGGTGGTITLTAAVTTASDQTYNAGTGAFTSNAGGTIDTGGGNILTITADTIGLGDTITNTGALTVQPVTTTRTIGLAGGAGDFSLSADEITILRNSGSSGITIGAAAGTGAVTLAGAVNLTAKTVTLRSGRINDAGNAITATDLTLNLSSAGAGGNTVATNVTTLRADTTGGTATADRALTVTETDALELGNITMNDGALSITSNGAITQAGGTAIVTTGNSTFDPGAAGNNITLNNANNNFATVLITRGNDVTLRDTNAINLGNTTVSGNLGITASGDITDSGTVAVTGTTTLAPGAANNITLDTATNDFNTSILITNGTNATFVDNTSIFLGTSSITGTLTVTCAGGTGNVGNTGMVTAGTFIATANNGSIVLDFGNNITNLGPITCRDQFTLDNGNNATTVIGAIDTSALNGTIDIRTGTQIFASNAGGTLNSGSGTITITADSMTIGDTITTTGTAILQPSSAARAIDLGTNTAGQLGLTDGELDQINAAILRVGRTTSGAITVSAAISPGAAATLSLITNGTVTQAAGGTITDTSLAIQSAGSVTLGEANNVANLAANVTTAASTFTYNDANALTVATVDGVTGVTTNAGTIAISTTAGALNITDTAAANDVDAGTSTVALSVGGAGNALTLAAGAAVSSTGGVTYTADDMVFGAASATSAGANIATLRPTTAARAIDLGTNTAGQLGLTDTELDTVTAGILRVGRTTAGAITVSAALTPGAAGTMSLITNGTVTQAAGATITEASLAIQSTDAVTLGEANDVANLAANVTGAGNAFTYNDANALTINTVDGVTGITTNAGDLTVTTAAGAVNFSSAVSGAAVTITATGGSILSNLGAGATVVTSTGDTRLESTTSVIGTQASPVLVNVGGLLYLGAGGAISGISGALAGTSSDSTFHLLYAAPGTVLWNGIDPTSNPNAVSSFTTTLNTINAQLNPYVANVLIQFMTFSLGATNNVPLQQAQEPFTLAASPSEENEA